MRKIFATKYIPKYQKNYHDLEWFQRDFITYTDHLKYQQCVGNLDSYFDRVEVTNFDLVNNKCRGDYLINPIIEHQTIFKNDFINFPEKNKDKIVLAAFRKNRHNL